MATGGPVDIARAFYRRAKRVNPAVRRGVRNASIAVNRAQIDNLRGSHKAPPGSYPVPNRSGNLMRGANWAISAGGVGLVFNSAPYAYAIHEGAGSSMVHGRRPFLDDAADSTDWQGIMRAEVRKAIFAL